MNGGLANWQQMKITLAGEAGGYHGDPGTVVLPADSAFSIDVDDDLVTETTDPVTRTYKNPELCPRDRKDEPR